MALSLPKEQLRKEINGECTDRLDEVPNYEYPVKSPKDACLPFCLVHFTEILKNSDLEKTSSKEVRNKLELKLKVDLSSQKKQLDKL